MYIHISCWQCLHLLSNFFRFTGAIIYFFLCSIFLRGISCLHRGLQSQEEEEEEEEEEGVEVVVVVELVKLSMLLSLLYHRPRLVSGCFN